MNDENFARFIATPASFFPSSFSNKLKDLLLLMLTRDPSRRIGVQDCLKHPFIADAHSLSTDDEGENLQSTSLRKAKFDHVLSSFINANSGSVITSSAAVSTSSSSPYSAQSSTSVTPTSSPCSTPSSPNVVLQDKRSNRNIGNSNRNRKKGSRSIPNNLVYRRRYGGQSSLKRIRSQSKRNPSRDEIEQTMKLNLILNSSLPSAPRTSSKIALIDLINKCVNQKKQLYQDMKRQKLPEMCFGKI